MKLDEWQPTDSVFVTPLASDVFSESFAGTISKIVNHTITVIDQDGNAYE